MNILPIAKTIFFLSILAILSSCSSSGSDTSANSGRVSILLTDGPTDRFDQINITLESISFLSDDNAPEVILFEETRVINLLALQNYSDLLATTTVPVGSYSKIRLHVSQVELIEFDDEGIALEPEFAKLPANGKIDLNPRGSFDVVADAGLMIELDMDANKSIQVVETGNGKFIFRPVIFVNILGEEELKLVVLDGKILARTETSFQLCEVEDIEVDDGCLEVLISDDTVVQDKQINVVDAVTLEDSNLVTVLGKANSKSINALHIVAATEAGDSLDQVLLTGAATSVVDVDNKFGMKTGDGNDVVPSGSLLAVELVAGTRIFDKYGVVITDNKIVDGTDVDVFGLSLPDLATIDTVRAAFVIANNENDDEKVSGVVVATNDESEITVTVVDEIVFGELFSGDVCIDASEADTFLLGIVAGSISSQEITINELQPGQLVDVYSDGTEDDGCLSADVVLVTES